MTRAMTEAQRFRFQRSLVPTQTDVAALEARRSRAEKASQEIRWKVDESMQNRTGPMRRVKQ